jgi:hypothetical protein
MDVLVLFSLVDTSAMVDHWVQHQLAVVAELIPAVRKALLQRKCRRQLQERHSGSTIIFATPLPPLLF